MTVGKPLSRIIFRSVLVTLVLWYLYVFSQLLVYQTQPKEIVSLKASFQKNMELSRREQITNDITTLKTDVVNLAKGIVDSEDVGTKKQKLQDKLDNIYLTTGRPYQGDLWEISDHTPQWMKDYFSWHKEERNRLDESNWESHRILLMQCLKGSDTKCGGTADRLKPFLFLLREAYESKRFLVIHWTLPARLEEFLVPPKGGIDWRVPKWFEKIIRNISIGRRMYKPALMKGARNASTGLIRTRAQSTSGGAEYYDEELSLDESSFAEVYHDVWRIFFTPSKPVRKLIEGEMVQMGLVPGQYAAAHLRALYGRVTDRPPEEATEWTQNALNCASKLRPGGPFLFASDHSYSTEAAIAYGKEKSTKVVSRKHEQMPLHFDKDVENRQPYEFYDTFVDLYLMGMGKCVTFNRGGFGTWALLIGYDSACKQSQKTSSSGIGVRCNWTEPSVPSNDAKPSGAPLFLEPMPP